MNRLKAIQEALFAFTAPNEQPSQAELYTARMAEQRRAWREQDLNKFRDTSKDPAEQKIWRVYAYSLGFWGCPPFWYLCGTRPMRPHRRRSRTFSQLGAAVRAQFGLTRDTSIRLISVADDKARLARKASLAPPTHFRGRF